MPIVSSSDSIVKSDRSIEFRDLSPQNLLELKTRLKWENFNDIFLAVSVDDKYNRLVGTISHCLEVSCPVKKVKIKRNRVRWLNDDIRKTKQQLGDLYSEWRLTGCGGAKARYNQLKKTYRKLILKGKSDFVFNEIKKSHNPSRTSWKFVNESRKNKKSPEISNIELEVEGVKLINPLNICNAFNNFFSSTSDSNLHNINVHKPIVKETTATLHSFKCLTLSELSRMISSMQPKTSAGSDGISMKIVKFCYSELEKPLLHLVNSSLESGDFPSSARLALIRPIHKKGSKLLLENYRPISLLPTISKILEKAVCNRLIDYLHENNLLFSNQYGYQKAKSTKLALIDFVTKCIDAMEGGEAAAGCFIDISKAFDCVYHPLLLRKLEALGVGLSALSWIASYLSGRKHQTTVNFSLASGHVKQFNSDVKENGMGVPQGSILGPILFLIYINDIPNYIPRDKLTIFADDTSLFIKNRNFDNIEIDSHIQLSVLSQYFSDINLKINPDKSNFMFFTTEQKKNRLMSSGFIWPQIVLGENILEESDCVDYLGVRLDGGLKWDQHIDKLSSTLASNIFVLRDISRFSCLELARTVYFSLIESHIRYSIVLWGLSSKQNLQRIFKLQKKAIRCILKLKPNISCKPHFRNLRILTTPSLYIFETVSFIKDNNLVQTHNHQYNTRNRNINHATQHRLKVFESKPAYAGLKYYSMLPNSIRDISDASRFKQHLKDYLIEACVYALPDLAHPNNLADPPFTSSP